jgi:hypothetical protein
MSLRIFQLQDSDVPNLFWIKWQTIAGYIYKNFDQDNYYAVVSEDEYKRSSPIRKGYIHRSPFNTLYYLNVTKTGEFLRYKQDAAKIKQEVKGAAANVGMLIKIQEKYEVAKQKEANDIKLYIEEHIQKKEFVAERTEVTFQRIGETLSNGVKELVTDPIKTMTEVPIIGATNVRDNTNKLAGFLSDPTNQMFVVAALVAAGYVVYTKRDDIAKLAI